VLDNQAGVRGLRLMMRRWHEYVGEWKLIPKGISLFRGFEGVGGFGRRGIGASTAGGSDEDAASVEVRQSR
jgi:hypothetical protein